MREFMRQDSREGSKLCNWNANPMPLFPHIEISRNARARDVYQIFDPAYTQKATAILLRRVYARV